LRQRYLVGNFLTEKSAAAILQLDYFNPFENRKLRYCQRIAIDKTVEAVMIKSKTVDRVLYLADRNKKIMCKVENNPLFYLFGIISLLFYFCVKFFLIKLTPLQKIKIL